MPDPIHHETSDFPVRPIAITFGAILLGLALISGGMEFIYHFHRTPVPPRQSMAHGPTYRTSIEKDRSDLAARFKKNLAAPHWIDRGNGIAGIPVDQAIDQIVADGKLPTWPASETLPLPRNRPAPERRSP